MSGQTYTPEEQRAAWAEYYRQQGYDEASIAAALGPAGSGSSTASTSQGGVGVGAPSQWSTYDSTAASTSYKPQAVPTSGPSTAHVNAAMPADVAKLYSADYMGANIYAPGQGEDGAGAPKHKPKPPPGKRDTVIRKGNGRTWEDPTLLDWDPKWYRLFVGDVSNDVNEKTLDEAFGKYPSYAKCKVVRDRLSLKAKYGFIAFKDPEDFLRAWKENDGKYIGNRPIRLSKVKDEQYGGVDTVTVSGRKAKMLDKVRQNRGKPLDGRPVPW